MSSLPLSTHLDTHEVHIPSPEHQPVIAHLTRHSQHPRPAHGGVGSFTMRLVRCCSGEASQPSEGAPGGSSCFTSHTALSRHVWRTSKHTAFPARPDPTGRKPRGQPEAAPLPTDEVTKEKRRESEYSSLGPSGHHPSIRRSSRGIRCPLLGGRSHVWKRGSAGGALDKVSRVGRFVCT